MAPTRVRSPSPSPSVQPSPKKSKTESSAPYDEGVASKFAPNLFHTENVTRFKEEYTGSAPFKHAIVGQLFDDTLLRKVKDEILGQLSFSEKETDIYKVGV